MTAAAPATAPERDDVRTIVGSGIKLGVITTVGVVGFAMLARSLSGAVANVLLSALVVLGGVLAAYLPSVWVRPRSVDGIAWSAMVGLLGALVFTVFDVALLRPLSVYHWTWDEIGGGSGFWYIPVWWMGSAFLAWLGAWIASQRLGERDDANPLMAGVQTAGLGVILFAVLAAVGAIPFHPAAAALGFAVALVVHVPLAAAMHRR